MALNIVQESPAARAVPGTLLGKEQISWSAEIAFQLGGQVMNKTEKMPRPPSQEARRGKPRREREGPRPGRCVQGQGGDCKFIHVVGKGRAEQESGLRAGRPGEVMEGQVRRARERGRGPNFYLG